MQRTVSAIAADELIHRLTLRASTMVGHRVAWALASKQTDSEQQIQPDERAALFCIEPREATKLANIEQLISDGRANWKCSEERRRGYHGAANTWQ